MVSSLQLLFRGCLNRNVKFYNCINCCNNWRLYFHGKINYLWPGYTNADNLSVEMKNRNLIYYANAFTTKKLNYILHMYIQTYIVPLQFDKGIRGMRVWNVGQGHPNLQVKGTVHSSNIWAKSLANGSLMIVL